MHLTALGQSTIYFILIFPAKNLAISANDDMSALAQSRHQLLQRTCLLLIQSGHGRP